jgi:N-acetylmuramoyl-L-alanine amidase
MHGVDYMPLKLFCAEMNYECQWDRFRGVATVHGSRHDVTFAVGSSVLLVDGRAGRLTHPIRWYRGAVMAPQILEEYFTEPAARTTAVQLLQRHPVRHIVLDPGHGGKDPGARGVTSTVEKVITLDLSKRIADVLRQAGYQVSLTRSNDTYIALEDRTKIAHQRGADFFISIHANANNSSSLQGMEVYYLNPKSMTHELNRAAAQGKMVALPYAASSMQAGADVKAILWDMRNVEHRRQAIELGNTVGRKIANKIGAKYRGVRAARFKVLRDANIPAALLEVGYLTHSTEGRRLAQSSYRQQLAQAIGEGLQEYFSTYRRTDGFTQ